VEQARQRLVQWDRQMAPDSRDATLYESWARRLWRMLVLSRLDATLADDFIARRRDVFIPALTETTSSAWLTKRPARWRDQLLLDALAETLAGAVNTAKDQADPWPAWGTLHTALFHHPLAVARAARQRFDVGPFGRGGDADTVMSTGGIDLEQTTGASFRFIADLGDWDRSVATNAPGQSGSPASPHFADLAPLWSAGDYFPLAFTDAAVGEHEESRLMLTPRR
jgi:penicillin amidase